MSNINKSILSDKFTGKENVSLKSRAKRIARATGTTLNMSCLLDEEKAGKPIQISITNSDTSAHTLAVFAGELTTVQEIQAIAGENVDAILVNGVAIKDNSNTPLVTCDCPKLEYYRRYLLRNPTRIDAFQLTTDNELQFAQPLKLVQFDPFQGPVSDSITPKTYLKPEQFNRTMVEINNIKHFMLDHSHVFIVTVGPSRTLDITMLLGTSFDTANALYEMSEALLG